MSGGDGGRREQWESYKNKSHLMNTVLEKVNISLTPPEVIG